MPNTITQTVEESIKTFMSAFTYMPAKCDDIQKIYYTSVNSAISGLGDSDPVTLSTKLTKSNVINGITLTEQLENFLGNASVVTGDYYATLVQLTNGIADSTATINAACEYLGEQLRSLANDVLTAQQRAKVINDLYTDNQISTVVAAIDSDRVVYGSNSTASKFSSASLMISQLLNMIGNSDTTSGDYMSTVSNWTSC